MNSLSWLLYLGDVLPSLGNTLLLVGILTLVVFALHAAVVGAEEWPFDGVISGRAKPAYQWMDIGTALVILASFIPAKETIYLIAGSEAGEAVVTTEQGKAILNDVQEVIKFQLDALKGPDQ